MLDRVSLCACGLVPDLLLTCKGRQARIEPAQLLDRNLKHGAALASTSVSPSSHSSWRSARIASHRCRDCWRPFGLAFPSSGSRRPDGSSSRNGKQITDGSSFAFVRTSSSSDFARFPERLAIVGLTCSPNNGSGKTRSISSSGLSVAIEFLIKSAQVKLHQPC
jgi:hypothetical protein